MEYKKEYRDIGFRIIFTRISELKGTLSFAAQPYELMLGPDMNNKPETFLIVGRIEVGEQLHLSFTYFTFQMTPDFHRRLGELYEVVKTEYRNTILKKT